MKVNKENLTIRESIHGNFFYHLAKDGKPLCGEKITILEKVALGGAAYGAIILMIIMSFLGCATYKGGLPLSVVSLRMLGCNIWWILCL